MSYANGKQREKMCDAEGGAGWWREEAVQVTGPQNSSLVCLFWSSAVFQSLLRVINAEDLHLTDMTTEGLTMCKMQLCCISQEYLSLL